MKQGNQSFKRIQNCINNKHSARRQITHYKRNQNCTNNSIPCWEWDWVKVLCPTRHKI